MEIFATALFCLFLASLAANFVLFKKTKELQKKPQPQPDYDATQLMHDLTAGPAIVKITRLNPTEIIMRSPRDRG